MESMQKHNVMTKLSRPDAKAIHEVVFAIKQNNLDELEKKVLEMSDPDSPKYQQWMTFQEVGEMTQNTEGSAKVLQWLDKYGIDVTSKTVYSTYITAKAPIYQWEHLFQTTFYEWESNHIYSQSSSNTKSPPPVKVVRSEDYSLPLEIAPHVSTVFYTCQALPKITHYSVPKSPDPRKSIFSTDIFAHEGSDTPIHLRGRKSVNVNLQSSTVTVSFLDSYYYINSQGT
jgi:subtilase family serine protease